MQTQLSKWSIFLLLTQFHLFRYMRKLKRNKIKARALDFPSLLYPTDGYDPDDIEHKLLQNPIAVRVSVFFSHQIILIQVSINEQLSSFFVLYSHHQDRQFLRTVEKPKQRVVRQNSMA